ncbi:MAG: hypothetical protein R2724_27405 [Bryobacterales bacterium]
MPARAQADCRPDPGRRLELHALLGLDTAEYGDYTAVRAAVDQHVRDSMKQVLKEIQTGEFANEWMAMNKAGREKFRDAQGAADAADRRSRAETAQHDAS